MKEANPMIQADSVLSTPPTNTSAIYGLEPDVCDLDRLTEIAEDLVRAYMNSELVEPQRERQGELALCMLGILREKMQTLKKDYYAAAFAEKVVRS
jgi:hypothetical protein